MISFRCLFVLIPVSLLLAAPAGGSERETPDRRPGWTAGLGAVYLTRAYRGLGDRFVPLPFLAYRGTRLAVLGPRATLRLFSIGPAVVSAGAAWRFAGYDPKDSTFMSGMEQRRDTLDAGAALAVRLPARVGLELEWKVDTLGRYKGYEVDASLRRTFPAGPFRVAPSVEWTYLSSNLTSTYYGVRADEARTGRPAYEPGRASTIGAGLSIFYQARENLSFFTGVRLSRLQSALTESPIVAGRVETRTLVGLMWNLSPATAP